MTFSMELSYFFFLFFFFFLPFLKASEPKRCLGSYCRGNTIPIRFPFWLESEHPSSCGYPGFNLHCTNHDTETVLKIPNSGPFVVREIDEGRQRIRLNDPENCLARRLLSFNVSDSPFSPLQVVYYTFFTCPNETPKPSYFKPIHCLSNSTTTFFAVPFELTGTIPSACQIFKTLLVPVTSLPLIDVGLNDQDLWLRWDSPDCTICLFNFFAHLCGFKTNSTLQVKCFVYLESGNPWILTLKYLCMYALLPLFTVTSIVVLCTSYSPPKEQDKTVEIVEMSQSVPLKNETPCSN